LRKWFKEISGTILLVDNDADTTLPFTSTKEMKHLVKTNDRGDIHIKKYEVSEIITKYSKLARQLTQGKILHNDINISSIWKFYAAKRYI